MGASGGDAAAASAASVAYLVAEHGLRGNEPAVAHVLRLARRHHVLPVHAAVVADRSLPDVVRERALGRLLAGLPRRADARTEAFDDAA
jgi:hypothetical protein